MSNYDDEKQREKERLFLEQPSVASVEQFNVVRRVYQQDVLNRDADYQQPRRRLSYRVQRLVRSCGFDKNCFTSALPIIRWLPKYKVKQYLAGDIIAGLTVAVMHIPQGMGYALLAEVSPVVGLYMAFFPVLMYIILGTSPHVSMGTFAIACLMTGKIVSRHADTTTHLPLTNATDTIDLMTNSTKLYDPMQVLSLVTLTVGCFQLLMWIFRLGAVATLLSDPLVSGFTTAAAFYVLSSQVKDLLGVKLPKMPNNFQVIFTVIYIIQRIHLANLAAVVISIITMVIIATNNELLKGWVAKKCSFPVPIELLAIVIGTLISKFGELQQRYGIRLVGDIPTGLPVPSGLPPLELLPEVALPCFTITMVTFTISMSMALIFASKAKYEVQGNQELLALGASNVFGSFFCCAPMCASLSRSYIQFQAGAKTNITSLVSCICILCLLLWVGPFFEQLPRSVLAGIIAVSLKGMFMQVKDLVRFIKLSYLDASVWIITFLVTLLINIDYGLGAGLLASVGTLFMRSQEAHTCLLGRVKDTDLYLDLKRYRAAEEIPGVKIFRYCGGLNFATKNHFREAIFRKVGVLRSPEPRDQPASQDSLEWDPHFAQKVNCVIIEATALCYVDAPGIKMLHDTEMEFGRNNITVLLAGASGPVLEMIEKFNKVCPETFQVPTFPTVHDAVIYYMMLIKKKYKETTENKPQNGNEASIQINDHVD